MNSIEALNEVRKQAEKVLLKEVQPQAEEFEAKLFILLLTEKISKVLAETKETKMSNKQELSSYYGKMKEPKKVSVRLVERGYGEKMFLKEVIQRQHKEIQTLKELLSKTEDELYQDGTMILHGLLEVLDVDTWIQIEHKHETLYKGTPDKFTDRAKYESLRIKAIWYSETFKALVIEI